MCISHVLGLLSTIWILLHMVTQRMYLATCIGIQFWREQGSAMPLQK